VNGPEPHKGHDRTRGRPAPPPRPFSHGVELLSSRDGESHRILLEDSECEIVLRHEDVDRRSQEILARYRIPADRSPDLMAMKPSPRSTRQPR